VSEDDTVSELEEWSGLGGGWRKVTPRSRYNYLLEITNFKSNKEKDETIIFFKADKKYRNRKHFKSHHHVS
jgi:hypothetical protein